MDLPGDPPAQVRRTTGEDLEITLTNVIIDGGFADMQDASNALLETIQGRRVTVGQIHRAASLLEQAYAARGYILARVIVPPQKLEEAGQLHLSVVDGFIESVQVAGLSPQDQARIKDLTQPLVGMRHVTLAQIERRLLLVQAGPGITLSSTLKRGVQPGGTQLLIYAQRKALTGAVGYDNRLPGALGVSEVNAVLAINNAFGFGEQIHFAGTTYANLVQAAAGRARLNVIGGGGSLPLGNDGLRATIEFTHAATRPLPAAGAPATQSLFDRLSLGVRYPIVLTREQSLSVQGSYEQVNEDMRALGFDGELYSDRYQAARLQADGAAALPGGGTVTADGLVSKGLGGRSADQAAASGTPLSREGASPTFTKLDVDLRYHQPLGGRFDLDLIGHGQGSFHQPLFLAEQFALDGAEGLSAFDAGALEVDEGATLRGEVAYEGVLGSGILAFTPYIFGAAGSGVRDMPTAAERGEVTATSFGVGLRLATLRSGFLLGPKFDLQVARGTSDAPNQPPAYRVNLNVSGGF